MKTYTLLNAALRRIKILECLAELVASGQIKSEISDGTVVYWHDENCLEAYEKLDEYCR